MVERFSSSRVARDEDWLDGFAEGLHTAAAEFDVLLVGGDGNADGIGPSEAPTQTWDTVSGSLEPAGTLAEGRSHHTATRGSGPRPQTVLQLRCV